MWLRTCIFGLAVLSAQSVTAQDFRAQNRVAVTAVPGGFDVASGGGFGARGMWCAAADYAIKVLRAGGTERIYVSQGREPGLGQRAPVRFTLDAGGLLPSGVFIVGASLRRAGGNLSVDHAHAFCADSRGIHR